MFEDLTRLFVETVDNMLYGLLTFDLFVSNTV